MMTNECQITINDLVWTIKKVEPNSDYLLTDNQGFAYGMTFPDSLKIYIQDEGLDKQLFYKFIKHEITHAYIFTFQRSKEKWNEEELCEFIEAHADMIIDDSRWAAKQLFNYRYKK